MKFKYLLSIFILFAFQISSLQASNYYWVGGSGNWSEIGHWATVSGGNIHYSTIPGFDDDVFFDQNSFSTSSQSVNLNLETAQCNTMDWTGALSGSELTGDKTLIIRGSLILAENVNFNFQGNLEMEATSQSVILFTANATFNCSINFTGIAAKWEISDSIFSKKKIQLLGAESEYTFKGKVKLSDDIEIMGGKSITIFEKSTEFSKNFNNAAAQASLIFRAKTSIKANFFISGVASRVELFDTLSVVGTLRFDQGILKTNSKYLNCNYFISSNNNLRELDFGTSAVDIGNQWITKGENLKLYFQNNLIRLFQSNATFNGGKNNTFSDISFVNSTGTVSFEANSSFFGKVSFMSNAILTGDTCHISTATILGKAWFTGSNIYENLILTKAQEYNFTEGTTQEIANILSADGNCAGSIYLKSSKTGKTAWIKKTSGQINCNYLIIRDVSAIGGATFRADNSNNLGNSDGWIIAPTTSKSLFWIGGTGFWTDASHWSFQSGGTSGACVPSPMDDVFIDQNSFSATGQTIDINTENAFCRNLDFTGALAGSTLKSSAQTNVLNIFGSLNLSPNFIFQFDGVIKFEATNSGNKISLAGHELNNSVIFNGVNGEWTLQDDFSTTKDWDIILNNGTLITNDKNITCHDFTSTPDKGKRTLLLGTSIINVHHYWTLTSGNLALNAGHSVIVILHELAQFSAGDNLKYWDIEFPNPVGSATILGKKTTFNKIHFIANANVNLNSCVVETLLCDTKASISAPFNRFKTTVFLNNAEVLNDNTFGTLNLTTDRIYTFTAGTTQTIETALNANGNCSSQILLKSNVRGSLANFYHFGSDILVEYCNIQDINALAGATFKANKSTNLGNNPGWIFNNSVGRKLYWVLGNGSWSDPDHWALTSGGLGGNCIPTAADDVVFDNKSFGTINQKVALDCKAAFCRNMSWINIPAATKFFSTVTTTLSIYGNFTGHSSLNMNINSGINFESFSTANLIAQNGALIQGNINFDGVSGNFRLESDLIISGNITLNSGVFETQGKLIQAFTFKVLDVLPSTLNAQGSVFKLNTLFELAAKTVVPYPIDEITFSEIAVLTNKNEANIQFKKVNFQNEGTISTVNSNTYIGNYDQVTFADKGTIRAKAQFGNVNFEGKAIIDGNSKFDTIRANWYTEILGQNLINFGLFKEYTSIYKSNIFGTAILNCNAYFADANIFDTLMFTANHAYILGALKWQTVNKNFIAQGNNCQRIKIMSDYESVQAGIFKTSDIVGGYALELSDILASGGAKFYAGGPSKDISNNEGWIFSEKPGFVYGLPNDTIITGNQPITIFTKNFNGNEKTQYLWQDGSEKTEITVSQPKYLHVMANFGVVDGGLSCEIPSDLNIFYADIQNVSCKTLSDGIISIRYDKTQSYKFEWGNGIEGETLKDIPPGIYTLKVTDLNHSTSSIHSLKIISDQDYRITSQIKEVTCYGKSNGKIKLTVNGGAPPYRFQWKNNSQTADSIYNLPANTVYSVEITDQSTCPAEQMKFVLTQPSKLTLSSQIKSISCFGKNDGEIEISADGSVPPYKYQWINQLSQNSEKLSQIGKGRYTVQIQDFNNCDTLISISIAEPPKLTLSFSELKPNKCWNTSDGSATILPSGGTTPYRFEWLDFIGNQTPTESRLSASKYYKVKTTDKNGCEILDSIKWNLPAIIQVDSIQKSAQICQNSVNGFINIYGKGGTGKLDFLLNNSHTSGDGTFKNLSAGNYTLSISDGNKCQVFVSQPISIENFINPEFTIETENASRKGNLDGKVKIISPQGSGTTFEITDIRGTKILDYNKMAEGIYTIIATSKTACSQSKEFEIKANEYQSELSVPNIFTPNDDGVNDIFAVKATDILFFYGQIFNRWGKVIYQWTDVNTGWDGKINGSKASEGTYYYIITAAGMDERKFNLKSYFNLAR